MHIDPESLKEFTQGDETLLAELATMFVQSLPDCKARLRFAVRSRDALMLREVTHQLGSRLGYLQAKQLSDLARTLEQRAIANQLEGTGEQIDQMIEGLDQLVVELRLLTQLALAEPEED